MSHPTIPAPLATSGGRRHCTRDQQTQHDHNLREPRLSGVLRVQVHLHEGKVQHNKHAWDNHHEHDEEDRRWSHVRKIKMRRPHTKILRFRLGRDVFCLVPLSTRMQRRETLFLGVTASSFDPDFFLAGVQGGSVASTPHRAEPEEVQSSCLFCAHHTPKGPLRLRRAAGKDPNPVHALRVPRSSPFKTR